MHRGVLADQPRPQHVVDTADDECAEQGETDASPHFARGDEDERRWHPDERTADAWDDRQDGHHRPPEDRRIESHGPERQPAKRALGDADEDRALQRRPGDRHELSEHALLVGVGERQVRQHRLEQGRTAGQEVEHRVEQHQELKDEDRRSASRGRERGKGDRACAADEFACLGEDLRPVRRDVPAAGEGPEPAGELARLIQELLDARPDGLGDSQRFVRAGAKHGQQRCQHQRQHQDERRERRECLAASEPAEEPPVHRIAESREDGCQQDRQEEFADHRDERGRDRRDQQQEKGLAEAGFAHVHCATIVQRHRAYRVPDRRLAFQRPGVGPRPRAARTGWTCGVVPGVGAAPPRGPDTVDVRVWCPVVGAAPPRGPDTVDVRVWCPVVGAAPPRGPVAWNGRTPTAEALMWGDRMIHFVGFALESANEGAGPSARMQSASWRRRQQRGH